MRALSGASIRLVQHFKMGRPIPLFPWYETMAPETIVPFELTLASVLRESSRSIARFETLTKLQTSYSLQH